MDLYKSAVYANDLKSAVDSVQNIEALRGKAVMITGATGLIGSFLVDMLLTYNRTDSAAIDIYAVGRSIERLKNRFTGVNSDKLHLIEHDVNTYFSYDFNTDYIIHAASNAYPAAFNTDPVGTILSNLMGTNYLLDYAKSHNTKRFLFVSSGEVYGQGDPSLDAFCESYSGYVDPTEPRSCYPSSKRAAETLCVSYTKQYALDTVIVRPCHTYGPNTTKSDNRANAQFVNNAVAGQDIIMKSAGTQMRSYCYVADCASAILTVLIKGKSCEAYNIANRDARVTIAGFAAAVANAVGKKVVFENPTQTDNAERTAITYAVLDSKKLYDLGWNGRYSVEDGIANTIRVLKGE